MKKYFCDRCNMEYDQKEFFLFRIIDAGEAIKYKVYGKKILKTYVSHLCRPCKNKLVNWLNYENN